MSQRCGKSADARHNRIQDMDIVDGLAIPGVISNVKKKDLILKGHKGSVRDVVEVLGGGIGSGGGIGIELRQAGGLTNGRNSTPFPRIACSPRRMQLRSVH